MAINNKTRIVLIRTIEQFTVKSKRNTGKNKCDTIKKSSHSRIREEEGKKVSTDK